MVPPDPVGQAGRVTLDFRPLAEEDLPRLASWLESPHVRRWWPEAHDPASVRAAYLPMVVGSDPTEGLVVLRDGVAVGFVQRYRIADDPAWRRTLALALGGPVGRAVGINYLIGDERLVGRGLGRAVIAALVDSTWVRYADVPSIIVGVHQENRASWRALEGAGFRRLWGGRLESDDPSDAGPQYLYGVGRPPEAPR